MRILFLSQRPPFEPKCGVSIPCFHTIRHLRRQNQVRVACLRREDEPVTIPEDDAIVVPLNARAARVRALTGLATGRPLSTAYFDEPELRDRVHQLIHRGNVDLVFVFSSGMAGLVEPFDALPRIVQLADLDSEKWRSFARDAWPPRSWLYRLEANRLQSYEQFLATTFSRALVCSPREASDFATLCPKARMTCVTNGIDLEQYQPTTKNMKHPCSLIFTGVMDYWPNVDGVLWFCREVFPLIRSAVPEVTFTICGSRPTRAIRDLERLSGVRVTGSVPSTRPFLDAATVAVIPLRLARGVQNKLLEAMASGLPCVATQAAFGGIDAVAGKELLVADEASTFARAVITLLRDEALRAEMGGAARSAMEARYSWDKTLAPLDQIVEESVKGGQPSLVPR